MVSVRRMQSEPRDVGLAATTRRHVSGLRREELAMLAGSSVGYQSHGIPLSAGRIEHGRHLHSGLEDRCQQSIRRGGGRFHLV